MAQSSVTAEPSPAAERIESELDAISSHIDDAADNGTLGLAPAQPADATQENTVPEAGTVPAETGATVVDDAANDDIIVDPAAMPAQDQPLTGAVDAHGEMVAHDDAAHGADHHESSGLPQLDPTWFASQIFWLFFVFGFLYLMFSRSILPAISNTLENRHEHVQGDLDTAQRLKTEAENVHKTYEEGLEKARNRANDLYREVEEDIKAKSEKQQSELRERLQNETELAEARIAKTKNDAMAEMTTIAAAIASEAAKKIVGIDMDIKSAENVVKDLNNKSKKAA